MEKFCNSIDFVGMLVVETQGHSGGIAMLWRNKEELVLNSLSKNHVDTTVMKQGGDKFRITRLYGEPNRFKRRETWNLICTLSTSLSILWILIGDMNNVLYHSDKQCGRPYPQWLLQGFQEVLDNCNLLDMNLVGYPFTWERGYGTNKWVEVRLDYALVNAEFRNMFGDAKLTNLEITTYDHCPLLLEPYIYNQQQFNKKLRVENAWLRELMCEHIVKEACNDNAEKTLFDRISFCAGKLADWDKSITGSFRDRIKHIKQVLKMLKGRKDIVSISWIKAEKEKFKEVYVQKEVFWRQRAK